ncbi:MAG: metallophosphoesterase [Bacteroidales bacterium]|nr:metallophosphoesterase [Bacteroidales bacterium]
MIFVTGDTHGEIDSGKLKVFAKENPQLTKNDYVLIAGDFGGLWFPKRLESDLKSFSDLPFTILFVDGNHENFDLLNSYPVLKWNGGNAHIIKPDIIHLMRGQVFEIDKNIFFTFGGGTSVDKMFRKEGVSWWPQETPSYEEFEEAMANLNAINNKVDYIITHSCDERALYYPPLRDNHKSLTVYPENRLLSYFEINTEYRH